MTQEEKQLLLADLSARLPYGVKCYAYQYKIDGNDCECCGILTGINNGYFYLSDRVSVNGGKTYDERYLEVKPYLRPMSSMTEEERKDLLVTIVGNEGVKYFQVLSDGSIDNTYAVHQDLHNFNMHWIIFDKDTVTLYLDWLNKHHFDYRNLIERGLAIAVTEKIIHIKNKVMKCPEPNPCYFCYNGECFATHWYECSKGFRKPHEGKKGNKNNRYCKKGE